MRLKVGPLLATAVVVPLATVAITSAMSGSVTASIGSCPESEHPPGQESASPEPVTVEPGRFSAPESYETIYNRVVSSYDARKAKAGTSVDQIRPEASGLPTRTLVATVSLGRAHSPAEALALAQSYNMTVQNLTHGTLLSATHTYGRIAATPDEPLTPEVVAASYERQLKAASLRGQEFATKAGDRRAAAVFAADQVLRQTQYANIGVPVIGLTGTMPRPKLLELVSDHPEMIVSAAEEQCLPPVDVLVPQKVLPDIARQIHDSARRTVDGPAPGNAPAPLFTERPVAGDAEVAP